jgi:hypothetical protein
MVEKGENTNVSTWLVSKVRLVAASISKEDGIRLFTDSSVGIGSASRRSDLNASVRSVVVDRFLEILNG